MCETSRGFKGFKGILKLHAIKDAFYAIYAKLNTNITITSCYLDEHR